MKLPRFRFSISLLLVFVLIVGIWFAWVANRNLQVRQHQQNIFAIKKDGGFVQCESGKYAEFWLKNSWWQMVWPPEPIDPVVSVSFQRRSDRFWVPLPDSEEEATFVTDWSLEGVLAMRGPLESFPELRYLEFSKIPLPRHSLACIENLTQLETLNLEQTQITSADIVHLRDLTNLRWLSLRRNRIDDDCLVHLQQMQRLKTLHLASTRIGNQGMKYLVCLSSLEDLWLDNTRVTDEGLAQLARLSNLKKLKLWHSTITDEGLRNLESASNLESLSLTNEHVTKAGIARLEQRLPNCKVSLMGAR